MHRPTAIDFFCGAGGFSEGFKQQGFVILKGYDKWRPAIDTFSFNFGKNKGELLDILFLQSKEYNDFIENIIPDTDVILGSPPCVSFSSSNKSGKADKSTGIKLIETFLKIVAIKKFKKSSTLKAWFMENVSRSKDHIKDCYSFEDLGLKEWAKKRRLKPTSVAIRLKANTCVLNSADYGTPQLRHRAISGEIIKLKSLVIPETILSESSYITLGSVLSRLPSPNSTISNIDVKDPIYQNLVININQLTDHFYDTGLYESVWLNSKYLKTNHPYMGKMSFPENLNKPSRTVTATKIGTSREALIYKSEYKRKGNGEFRSPTVREAATLMGFPITYQFLGSENTKWKLIGNAVCPCISRALAATVRKYMGLTQVRVPLLSNRINTNGLFNLNTYEKKLFDTPPKRNPGSRFRRHPFKDGNITVTLSNYEIMSKKNNLGPWITSVQYGNGDGFPHQIFDDGFYFSLEGTIKKFEKGDRFLEIINNGFSEKIADANTLQKMHEEQKSINGFLEPIKLVEEVAKIIDGFRFNEPLLNHVEYFSFKSAVPKKQILALYAINKICTKANKNLEGN